MRRAAPKLVNASSRAVNLCETTLAYGKAEEPAPTLSRFNLATLPPSRQRDIMRTYGLRFGAESKEEAGDILFGTAPARQMVMQAAD